MKYLVKFFVVFAIFFYCNSSIASEIIAYIDMVKIMNTSKAGKSIKSQLEAIHKKNVTEFSKTEKKLKDQENDILSKKNVVSKEEYANIIKDLRKKAFDYQNDRRKKTNILTEKRLESTAIFMKELTPILSEYAKLNSISIVIQKKNIIIGKSNLDITNDILNIVNQKLDKIKLN